MATHKKRINISLPDDVEKALKKISVRDSIPTATKAAYFIKLAIEVDEDDVYNEIARQRDTKSARFVSHKDAWA